MSTSHLNSESIFGPGQDVPKSQEGVSCKSVSFSSLLRTSTLNYKCSNLCSIFGSVPTNTEDVIFPVRKNRGAEHRSAWQGWPPTGFAPESCFQESYDESYLHRNRQQTSERHAVASESSEPRVAHSLLSGTTREACGTAENCSSRSLGLHSVHSVPDAESLQRAGGVYKAEHEHETCRENSSDEFCSPNLPSPRVASANLASLGRQSLEGTSTMAGESNAGRLDDSRGSVDIGRHLVADSRGGAGDHSESVSICSNSWQEEISGRSFPSVASDQHVLAPSPSELDESDGTELKYRGYRSRGRDYRDFGNIRSSKSYPPPLSSIARRGFSHLPHMPWVHMKPIRTEGRFVLHEVKVDQPVVFHPIRKDGRLVLQLIRHDSNDHSDDEGVDECSSAAKVSKTVCFVGDQGDQTSENSDVERSSQVDFGEKVIDLFQFNEREAAVSVHLGDDEGVYECSSAEEVNETGCSVGEDGFRTSENTIVECSTHIELGEKSGDLFKFQEERGESVSVEEALDEMEVEQAAECVARDVHFETADENNGRILLEEDLVAKVLITEDKLVEMSNEEHKAVDVSEAEMIARSVVLENTVEAGCSKESELHDKTLIVKPKDVDLQITSEGNDDVSKLNSVRHNVETPPGKRNLILSSPVLKDLSRHRSFRVGALSNSGHAEALREELFRVSFYRIEDPFEGKGAVPQSLTELVGYVNMMSTPHPFLNSWLIRKTPDSVCESDSRLSSYTPVAGAFSCSDEMEKRRREKSFLHMPCVS